MFDYVFCNRNISYGTDHNSGKHPTQTGRLIFSASGLDFNLPCQGNTENQNKNEKALYQLVRLGKKL
jgi:hypothetical protein